MQISSGKAGVGFTNVARVLCAVDLFGAERNATLSEVVRGELHGDFVAGEDFDVVLTHTARDVADHDVAVFEFDAEHGVGEGVEHRALHLNVIFFGHSISWLDFGKRGLSLKLPIGASGLRGMVGCGLIFELDKGNNLMQQTFAAVFPGQGSQSVGMMGGFAEHHALVEATFAQASAALAGTALAGVDLFALSQQGPEAEINRTELTQPLMLTAGVAAWRVWQAVGGADPVCMAGHSLGEYTALVCAGAMDFSDAVRVVAERGRLMQAAVPLGTGAMAAVLGLDDAVVLAVCAEASQGAEVVEAVNFNSPGQVVIAGSAEAVARATPLLQEKGAKRVLPLPVSVPSHSSLMQDAAMQMAKVLEGVEIRRPQIPVLHNVDAAEHAEPDALRAALVSQLYRPVLWVDSVRAMQARGARVLLEFGPGKVLAGLTKRIERDLAAWPVLDAASLQAALQGLQGVE